MHITTMSHIDEIRYVYVHLLTYFTLVQQTPIVAHGHGAQARQIDQPAVLLPPSPPTLVQRPVLGSHHPSLQVLLAHKLTCNTHSTCTAQAVYEAADRPDLLAPNNAMCRRMGVGHADGDHWRRLPGLGQVGRVVVSREGAANRAQITRVSRRCTQGRARRSGRARSAVYA